MAAATTFIFVRHGQATHNTGTAPAAYLDPANTDATLTGIGVQQAYNLRAAGLGRDVDAVFCSPLRRCWQTLRLGVPGADRRPVELDDRLMEPQGSAICNRRMEKRELCCHVPESWILDGVGVVNPWDDANEGISVEEAHAGFDARVRRFTEAVMARFAGQRVLVFTHHDWIQTWMRIYSPESERQSIGNGECVSVKIDLGVPTTGGVNVARVDDDV